MALGAIGEVRELLVEPIADVLGLDGDQVTISTEVFDSFEQSKLSKYSTALSSRSSVSCNHCSVTSPGF